MALFVDLPNIYSHLVNSGVDDPKTLRSYFLNGLNFDSLSNKLTGEVEDIWIFYSGARFGPSNARVDGEYLKKYIDRINSLEGVTAKDVNIPGEQREAYTIKCDKCGEEAVGEWLSEKGIDSSITVHLFDTMNSWQKAYLLSGDADFVPVVSSLRRHGKMIVGAGFKNASPALVRECYHYIDIYEKYLKNGFVTFLLFRKNGILHKLLTEADPPENKDKTIDRIYLNLSCLFYETRTYGVKGRFEIFFRAEGVYNSKEIENKLIDIDNKFSCNLEFRTKNVSSEFLFTMQLFGELKEDFERNISKLKTALPEEYIKIEKIKKGVKFSAVMEFHTDENQFKLLETSAH